MTDFVSQNDSDERRRAAARDALRDILADAYTFVHSRHLTALALTRSADDYRNLELEQIEGPVDPRSPLILHVTGRVPDKTSIEVVRAGVMSAIEALRNNPDLEA